MTISTGHSAGARAFFLAAALSACGYSDLAAAQSRVPRFELTPYSGYRVGGEFEQETGEGEFELRQGDSQGLVFNVQTANSDAHWEVLYARQQTELQTQASFAGGPLLPMDVEYLHFGGAYRFGASETRPFLTLTGGVARFEPGPSDLSAENYLSFAFGGGVQLRATKRLGVRLQGRAFGALVNDDGGLFCGDPQPDGCAVRVDGTALIQIEASAGVVFRV